MKEEQGENIVRLYAVAEFCEQYPRKYERGEVLTLVEKASEVVIAVDSVLYLVGVVVNKEEHGKGEEEEEVEKSRQQLEKHLFEIKGFH